MPFSVKRRNSGEKNPSESDADKNAEIALRRDNESLDNTEMNEIGEFNRKESDDVNSSEDTSAVSFKSAFADGLLFRNPSLVDFVGLTPIIVGGTSVKNGLVLSAATLAVLFAVCVFASLTKSFLPKKLAPAVYTIFAAALLVGLTWIGYTFFSSVMFSLGLIFPLIAVNGINLNRTRDFALENELKLTVADALGKGLGFSAVLILTSAVREIFGYGTFWDIGLPFFSRFHSYVVCGVPGGFIVMAVFAALVRLSSVKKTELKK